MAQKRSVVRNKSITIKVSQEELKQIKEFCAVKENPVSDYARTLVRVNLRLDDFRKTRIFKNKYVLNAPETVRDKQFNVKITENEAKKIQTRCRGDKRGASAYIRSLILSQIKAEKKD